MNDLNKFLDDVTLQSDDYFPNQALALLTDACKNGDLQKVKIFYETCPLFTKSQTHRVISPCIQTGNLEIIQFLVNISSSDSYMYLYIESYYNQAVSNGHLHLLHYFLNSDEFAIAKIKNNYYFKHNLYYLACENGILSIVQYLLQDKDLKYDIYLRRDNLKSLKLAIFSGNLEPFKFFLLDESYFQWPDPHFNEQPLYYLKHKYKKLFNNPKQQFYNTILSIAFTYNQVSMVKYLFESPELKTHAKISYIKNWSLELIFEKNYHDIIQYLIDNKKVDLNKIKKYSYMRDNSLFKTNFTQWFFHAKLQKNMNSTLSFITHKNKI